MEGRKSFLLRVSAPLWRDIERWAQDDFRSVNAQVEYILRQAVQRWKRSGPDTPAPEAPTPPPSASPPPAAPEPPPPASFPGGELDVGRQD